MRKKQSVRARADLLIHWIDRLGKCRGFLLWALRVKDRRIIKEASRLYRSAAEQVWYATVEFLRHWYRRNPMGRVPLEVFERIFVRLREEAEHDLLLAEKLRGQGKTGRDALKAAAASSRTAGAIAKIIKTELEKRSLWTEKLGRELGIIQWL